MNQKIILQIIKKYGTPVYIYDKEKILKQINLLKNNLKFATRVKFLYAIKANFNPHLVKLIISKNFGIDAVSIEEAALALHCGAPKNKIMLTENNITDEEMHIADKLGIILNIGSLSRMEKFGQNYPGKKICLRLNPQIGGAGSHATNITVHPYSKFGIPIGQSRQALNIAVKYNLKIIGLHYHVGSGWLDECQPTKALKIFLKTALNFPDLKFLDLGGGFGIPYRPSEKPLNLKRVAEVFRMQLKKFFKQYGKNLEIKFEPGRFVVAQSGKLITRVNTIKKLTNGRIVVGVDTGMNQLVRPAMYGSYHAIANLTNPRGKKQRYDIVGNVCESADYFAKNRALPTVRENDLLAIDATGAYGMSMASNYQFRPMPPEILISGKKHKLIRPRQTFNDLLNIFNI